MLENPAAKQNRKQAMILLLVFAVGILMSCLLLADVVYRIVLCVFLALVLFLVQLGMREGREKILQSMKDHKIPWLICAAGMIFLLINAFLCFQDHSMATLYGKYMLIMQILLIPAVVFGMLGIYFWKWEMWKFYLIVGTLVGLAMMLAIPIGGAPDEVFHIDSSYHLSNLMMGIKENGGIMMRADDELLHRQSFARTLYQDVNGYDTYIQQLLTPLKDGTLVNIAQEPGSPAYVYFFCALGITIGRLLQLGTYQTLMLGRLMNFTVFMAMTTYAVKKIPLGKLLLAVLLLMPMTVQLGMSYSYDVFVIGTGMVITALSLKLALAEKLWGLSISEWIILAVCCVVLLPLKGKAYFLVSLLPIFILLHKRFPLSDHARKVLKKTFLILLAAALIFYVVWGFTGAKGRTYVPNMLDYNGKYKDPLPGFSISFFIANPFELIVVLGSTAISFWWYYIFTFVGNYLAWLDVSLPQVVAVVYCLLILFSMGKRKDDTVVLTHPVKKIMAIVSLLTVGFIFAGMLFAWSPIVGRCIQGVQGRYFIPIAALIFLLFWSDKFRLDRRADNIVKIVLLLSIASCIEFIIIRI